MWSNFETSLVARWEWAGTRLRMFMRISVGIVSMVWVVGWADMVAWNGWWVSGVVVWNVLRMDMVAGRGWCVGGRVVWRRVRAADGGGGGGWEMLVNEVCGGVCFCAQRPDGDDA